MAKADSIPASRSIGDQLRYPGVRPFKEPEEGRFFGRSRATEELLLRVLSVRLLLQFAPSGVGKTSILNAGLFPKLRQHNYFPCIVRLNLPNESLPQAVGRSLQDAAAGRGLNDAVIPDNAEDVWTLLAGTQLWSHDLLLLTPVLVFDQFEEVFTLRDEAFRWKFASEVGELVRGTSRRRSNGGQSDSSASDAPAPIVKIIISLREEYLGKLEEFSPSIPDLFHERLRLSPLTTEEAKEAIVEPARLAGASWSSPAFAFEEKTCLETLIDFIDGASVKVKVVEPLTLQLVCRQAEVLAMAGVGSDDVCPILGIGDFGGMAGLESLVKNYFDEVLNKLEGRATRKHAKEMFEHGLLDASGKRLMLEQGQIERRYSLNGKALNALVHSGLLRSEPRSEGSIFFEICHDRLTEAIAKNRGVKLPRWVWPTIAAGVASIVLVASAAIWAFHEKGKAIAAQENAEAARNSADLALRLLLGEGLVSRLREVGLSDALKQVLDEATVDESSKLPLALKLRHQGDILRERGTTSEAREKFEGAQRLLDEMSSVGSSNNTELKAEQARTLQRLGSLMLDTGKVTIAESHFAESIALWDQVLKEEQANPQPPGPTSRRSQTRLDAAETRIELGGFHRNQRNFELASSEYAEALSIAQDVWQKAFDQAYGDRNDVRFELGRAMHIYADAALGLALSNESSMYKGALAFTRASFRLRPLSYLARIQLGVSSIMHGSRPESGKEQPKLFSESTRHFDDLAQADPSNHRIQRERAAVQVLIAETLATCALDPKCINKPGRGALEAARISALESTGEFRWLAGLDGDNRSLQADVAWGLTAQSELLAATGRPDRALPLLDEAIAIRRKPRIDKNDVGARLDIADLFVKKSKRLVERKQPEGAFAALDQALSEIDGLPASLPAVQIARYDTIGSKILLLKKARRYDDAEQLLKSREELLKGMSRWDDRRQDADTLSQAGGSLIAEASALAGSVKMEKLRQGQEKYELAIRKYPFDDAHWKALGKAHQEIAKEVSGVELERARSAALAAAWMSSVLEYSDRSTIDVLQARLDLVIYLRDHQRAKEALPIAVQGLWSAREFGHEFPKSPFARVQLALAGVQVGLLRAISGDEGWEEILRVSLEHWKQYAKMHPSTQNGILTSDMRRSLGYLLKKANREVAAAEEYHLALLACQEALRLAKGAPERAKAQSCVEELAQLGYR